MKKSRAVAIAVVVLGTFGALAAFAGFKATSYVTFGSDGDGTYVRGSIGDARASTDNLQYIGCWVKSTQSSSRGGCNAFSTSRQFASCESTNRAFVEAAASVGIDSNIQFWYSGNTCTALIVRNYSHYRPATP